MSNLISEWQLAVHRLGFTDFVSPEDGFRSCSGKAWANAKGTGIYCWITSNGETYVGQALNARRRLRDHWKVHDDMVAAAFRLADPDALDEIECDLIEQVGALFPTRNIKHAMETVSSVPLDAILSEADRDQFLDGKSLPVVADWQPLPLLHQKRARTYAKMWQNPYFPGVLTCLRLYISNAIPIPARTENRFWSVSLLDSRNCFIRLNVGQQEMLTVAQGEGGQLNVRVLLPEPSDQTADGPIYQTDSFIHYVSARSLPRWFNLSRVKAARRLVIQLMRHTTALNSGTHCPQIVRDAFGQGEIRPILRDA